MNQPVQNKQDVKKKDHKRIPLFSALFGGKQALSIYEEDEVQSPLRTIIKTFISNRVGMIALGVFLLIFLTVTIGPIFYPVDLSYADSTQINVGPGFDMMKIPDGLKGNVENISIGPTFSVGTSKDGQVYVWGRSRINVNLDLKDTIPTNMGKVVQLAAGSDHILALNDQGKLFAWGSNRAGQAKIPDELARVNNIKEIYAGYQRSIVLTEDGHTYFFGNDRVSSFNHNHDYQGQLAKVISSSDNFGGLTFDGEVVFLGLQLNSYGIIPTNMGKVVDISATDNTFAALNDKGEVFVWGSPSVTRGEARVPEIDGKVIGLFGGRFHYVALTEDNNLYAWGSNYFNQAQVPKIDKEIVTVYNGYFQNYAVTASGDAITWGLKGYLMGTDEVGRDTFSRLLNGGRMTMTIGGVAVVISTIIGVIIGGVSGYFGGRIDMFFQRLSEMVASLPFLPFAMILSALIGNKISPNQRVYLIMVVLGLLSWPGIQRMVRAQVLSVREQEYVTAAKIVGINQLSIIFKHIVPNVITIVIVSATLGFSASMLTEAALSFLGFGVQAPQPTWGNMLNGARNSYVIQNFWWRWVFPSIALSICVICINLIGEGLREAIDPKSRER